MTHTYTVTGMTCSACEYKVKYLLQSVEKVTEVEVSNDAQSARIKMEKHIPVSEFQTALGGSNSKYQISAIEHHKKNLNTFAWSEKEVAKSWFETYKPILTIFMYITTVSLLIQTQNERFNLMQWMQHFMAGFFLTFSFFKMLDLKAFADSYAMYDVLARKIPVWGYVYAFIELVLGIANIINFNPLVTNLATFVVMLVSIIGVLQSVLNKKKIQCACLGAVFNLPMSTVTIIEDALMMVMSGAMVAWML